MQSSYLYATLLTLGAGLATLLGGLIPFFVRRPSKTLLALSLGLSAGVMIYISFVEMLAESQHALGDIFGQKRGGVYAVLAFFGGVAVAGVIDVLVPSEENPHELRSPECVEPTETVDRSKLQRVGLVTALALAIHNFPEGIATMITAVENPQLGLAIAMAVAIHNIPEGIAVAIPIYYATGSRGKALLFALLSGLAEPVGGLLALWLITPYITAALMSIVMAAVGGIMVFISIDELLPSARAYGRAHSSLLGFVAGMAIMAVSLILLA